MTPVTTFGGKYPLDDLIRPYLPRLAQGIMLSFYYAKQMPDKPQTFPLLVDSGGFASLFSTAWLVTSGKVGLLEISNEDKTETIHPCDVLELQEKIADVAFTLDFPIPPQMDQAEARQRQALTIANAHWALANRRRKDLPLFACIQAWDAASARECARAYKGAVFDGIAIGGLVPRVQDLQAVLAIIEAVRNEISDLPLHVFGLGKPETLPRLFEAGTDSVDSSAYVKLAADGRLWGAPHLQIQNASPIDRLHLALCNLAMATGQALPLSASQMLFITQNLKAHDTAHNASA